MITEFYERLDALCNEFRERGLTWFDIAMALLKKGEEFLYRAFAVHVRKK